MPFESLTFLITGLVVSVCPLYEQDDPNYELTYLVVILEGSIVYTQFEMLVYVNRVANSPYWKKTIISQLNPVQFQLVSDDPISIFSDFDQFYQ